MIPAKGLTVSWPFGAQKKNYEGWTPETQTTAPLTYLRSEKKQGITTNVYEAKVAPTKIVDPQILAALPKQLPAASSSCSPPPATSPRPRPHSWRRSSPAPGRGPMAYTFQDDSTFWVDPDTGLVIDVQRNQQRIAAIALPTGTPVPLIPAVAATYETTPASPKQAADDASNGSNVIRWLGVYIPIILLVLGVVLLALTAFLFWRGRRRGPTVPPAPTAGPGPAAGPGPEATHP